MTTPTPITLEEARSRVQRGIAKLDAWHQCKHDWRSDVNPDLLDMFSNEWCVLGQVFVNYEDGADAFGLHAEEDRHELAMLGFTLTEQELPDPHVVWLEHSKCQELYVPLLEAWKEALAE